MERMTGLGGRPQTSYFIFPDKTNPVDLPHAVSISYTGQHDMLERNRVYWRKEVPTRSSFFYFEAQLRKFRRTKDSKLSLQPHNTPTERHRNRHK